MAPKRRGGNFKPDRDGVYGPGGDLTPIHAPPPSVKSAHPAGHTMTRATRGVPYWRRAPAVVWVALFVGASVFAQDVSRGEPVRADPDGARQQINDFVTRLLGPQDTSAAEFAAPADAAAVPPTTVSPVGPGSGQSPVTRPAPRATTLDPSRASAPSARGRASQTSPAGVQNAPTAGAPNAGAVSTPLGQQPAPRTGPTGSARPAAAAAAPQIMGTAVRQAAAASTPLAVTRDAASDTVDSAPARSIPWRGQSRFDLYASNEPLGQFMSRLLTLEGIPSWTSQALNQASVNGRFRGRAPQLFDELAESYGLTWYFDGLALHVYSLSEMETRLIQLPPADVSRIVPTLQSMALVDARFPLRMVEQEGQVLVSGPPRFVQLVAEVIGNLAARPSVAEAAMEVRVFRLRFARAVDTRISVGNSELTVPGLAVLLRELVGGVTHRVSGGSRGVSRTLPSAQPGLIGKGLASQGAGESTDVRAGAVNDFSGSGVAGGRTQAAQMGPPATTQVGGGAADITRPPAATAAQAEAAAPSVSAEPRINAVIVRDHPARMPMYERLIAELDIESPLVEIEATVIDVAQDKSEQLGVDWRASLGKLDALYSPNELGAPGNPALDFSTDPRSVGRGLVGTLLVGSQRNFLLARVNALAESGDARLVSQPRVLTLNNSEAVLQSTSEFYVRVSGRDQVDLFNVSLGLSLRVTPTLYEQDGSRRFALQIRIEDGNTSSGAQVDEIPVVNRNIIATQAVVGDGQSLLIAGHVVERKQADISGLPGLGRVPGLGWLFGQRSSTDRRVERMFLITPKLVQPGRAAATSLMLPGTSGAVGPGAGNAAGGVTGAGGVAWPR